eukprot:g69007.t1
MFFFHNLVYNVCPTNRDCDMHTGMYSAWTSFVSCKLEPQINFEVVPRIVTCILARKISCTLPGLLLV